jgi:hypothetical protein
MQFGTGQAGCKFFGVVHGYHEFISPYQRWTDTSSNEKPHARPYNL